MEISDNCSKRFWSKVNKLTENECWIWTAGKDYDGYGVFWLNGRNYRTNRLSLFLKTNDFDSFKNINIHSLHSCDIPSCVNPNHLRWGGPIENTRDKINRSRCNLPKGNSHHYTKYSDELVLEIKKTYNSGKYTYKNLADIYEPSISQIRYILKKR